MLNPYIAGAPVTEASMFFGRQDVFDWIERSLAGKYVDHILVIHGQRRVGKTSVLKQIPNFLPDRYIQIYFDLQGRTQTTLDRFLWWLAREIARTVHDRLGLEIPRPDQEAFTQDSEFFHTQFLSELRSQLDDRVLLLTFDEFDTLSTADGTDGLARSLTNYLRRLFDVQGLNFIFSIGSSGKKLENMQAAYTEFFKAALYKKISFLSEKDSYQLITRPVEGVLMYDPEATGRIYQITSGHPYYTQLTCHELFSNCQRTDRYHITGADVDRVLPDVVERGTVNLKFVWDEANDLEKWALACLAQGERSLDFQGLTDELRRQRVRFSDPDLNSALLHLREKDILTRDNRFIVDLMRLWLRTNRPLDRVHEELEEVNPIANRLIEIGDEYRQRGSNQEALQSYEQALSADPGNLKAQVSIATIHLKDKDFEHAAQAFEKALLIDPEDIQSRSGFCEARMALGGEAQTRGDNLAALEHYQRVVAINPEHNQARQRLSEILRRQAEDALAQGREGEALLTFNDALDYTPDDVLLQKRYDEVCEQVKDRVLKDLLEKAEAEQERENWEKAITHLEDYLRFEHGDAEVVSRLAEVRRQQHLSRLVALKAKALEMGKAERWELAIESWQAYLDLEPEDREEAEAALNRAGHYQRLDESYKRGEEALRAKDFPQAIRLFQDIIAGEPAYKDTARLLSDAIVAERKRKPLWSSPWIWVTLIITVLAVLAGTFGGDVLGFLTSRSNHPQATAVAALITAAPASQATSTPTLPITPTLTVTPLPMQVPTTSPPTATAKPGWITDFGQPVLDYIDSNEPDFEDDFSEAKPEWRLTSWSGDGSEKTLRIADFVTDGALTMEIEPGAGLTLKANMFDATDFALQFDFIEETGGDANVDVYFRSSENGAYQFFFSPIGKPWNWAFIKQMQESETLEQDSSEVIGFQKPFRVLLIVKGDQMAVYFKPSYLSLDQPGGFVQDSTFTNGVASLYFGGGSAPSRVKLDNLKYWELKDENAPAWVADFAQPILDEIETKNPWFEEDFTAPDAAWHFGHWGDLDEGETSRWRLLSDYCQDGAMKVDFDPNTYYFLNRDLGSNSHYVVQFDVILEADDPSSTFYFSPGKQEVWMGFYPDEQWWGIGDSKNSSIIYGSGYSPAIVNNPMTVLFIAQGYEFAVFLNRVPLTYFESNQDRPFW